MRDRSLFAPPEDTDKAYRVVRTGDLWRPVREVRHYLPAERDAFVGRTAELRALAARLDAGTRLVTVLGPGGTGKTQFVRRYAWTWLGDWAGNRRDEGIVLGNLGLLHSDQHRLEEARLLYEAALAIGREVGDRRYEGYPR